MYKVKICGLRRAEDIEAANRLRPDYIGFVFADSKRKVTREQAARLKEKLDPDIRAVGVFVNEAPERAAKIAGEDIIQMIQLHGDEDQEYIRRLRSLTEKPIIKAVRVQSREQIERAGELSCDCLLLDTYTAGQYGGSGIPFDYSLIPEMKMPFFLAGGLNADNVAKALKESHAFAADVSSAVETDGWKDAGKMEAFIRAVREL